MTDSTPDETHDDFILQERLSGRSARSIGKQLSLTVGEVNASLDRTLPTIDNAQRLRHISLDLSRLDGLVEVFYKRAIEKADAQAGLCVVKILDRKAALLGLDSAQKLDIIQVTTQQQPHEFDKIYDAVMRLKYGDQRPPSDDNGSDDPAAGAGGDREGGLPPLGDGDDGKPQCLLSPRRGGF